MQAGTCLPSTVAVTWQAKQPNVRYCSAQLQPVFQMSAIFLAHNIADSCVYTTGLWSSLSFY